MCTDDVENDVLGRDSRAELARDLQMIIHFR